MKFTKELKEKLIKELDKRIGKLNKNFYCPICKNKNFNGIDGFTRRSINQDISNVNLGCPSVPSMSIVCSNCGYVADFAVGALGFLENKEKTKGEKNDKKSKN